MFPINATEGEVAFITEGAQKKEDVYWMNCFVIYSMTLGGL